MIKISIKSGLITLLVMIIYGVILITTKNIIPTIPGIEYLILGGGIFSAHYFYKSEYHKMSYLKGVKLGMGVSCTVAFVLGIWFFIYSVFIDPNFIITTTKNIAPILKQKGFDENSIRTAIDQINRHFTPIKLFLGVFIVLNIIGLLWSLLISLISLLITLISKKNNDNG